MSLKLVLGSSGAGKTHYIYEEVLQESIKHPEKNYILIVPEQFTMATQKDIVNRHVRHGVMNIDIVSFNRLAFRIFSELCVDRLSILDDTGKTLVLRHVTEQNKDRLLLFKDKIKYFGFVEEMKSSISELYQYGINEDMLEEVIKKLEGKVNTSMKLHDLQVIYEAFKEYVKNMSHGDNVYITKEEVLARLCDVVGKSKILKGSCIYIDGFTGFTPVQNRLLKLLLEVAESVSVAVTIPKKECDFLTPSGFEKIEEHELFAMSKTTVNDLIAMCADLKLSCNDIKVLDITEKSRWGKDTAMAHIEDNLFRVKAVSKVSCDDRCSIYMAENSLKEAEFIADRINFLVMYSGLGIRYRDIAVVTGDMDSVRENVKRAFNGRGIPHFMDNKRSLINNPFVNVIRTLIKMVEDGFSYESVFSYLKNGMSEIGDQEADLLENYVLACGIRGYKKYKEPFEWKYRGLTEENFLECERIRQKFVEEIGSFAETDFSLLTVRQISDEIRKFVEEKSLKEKLERYCKEFTEMGCHSLAGEYSQTYQLTMELFEKLDSILGDEKITMREYRKLLDDGFKEIKVGIIPLVMDQVVVGDIQRTRLGSIKYLFVMGVNDGVIPKLKGKPGLLSQNDRNTLRNIGFTLSPSARESGFIQKFYLYLNLTKPSEKLILSYSLSGMDGSLLRPSYLINVIRDLFTDLNVLPINDRVDFEKETYTLETAFETMASEVKKYGTQEQHKSFNELYSFFKSDSRYREALDRVVEGAFYTNNQSVLDRTVAAALYGEKLSGSITRIEKYAACAYAHFLNYGLKLQERAVYEIKAADIGNIFHEVIEKFSKRLLGDDIDIESLTEDRRKAIIDETVDEIAKDYGGHLLKSSARNRYMIEKIKRVTNKSTWAMIEHIRRGKFNPDDFELKVREGRIDRVDRYDDGENIYIKIIDYKSGNTTFDPVEVENGIQLQLIYYMDTVLKRERAVREGRNVEPGGAFYFNIKDPVVDFEQSLLDSDVRDERFLKEYTMTGVVNGRQKVIRAMDCDLSDDNKISSVIKTKYGEDDVNIRVDANGAVLSAENFENLIKRVKNKVDTMTDEIREGIIDIKPYRKGQYSPCMYCNYKSICAFDNKNFENSYRTFKNVSAAQIEKKWNVSGEE